MSAFRRCINLDDPCVHSLVIFESLPIDIAKMTWRELTGIRQIQGGRTERIQRMAAILKFVAET